MLWLIDIERVGMIVTAIHMNMVPFYVMLCVVALGGAVSFGQAAGAYWSWRVLSSRSGGPEKPSNLKEP
jgi:hypothetical protein